MPSSRARTHWLERLKRRARKPVFMLGALLVTIVLIGWGLTLWQIDSGRTAAISAEIEKNDSLVLAQEERILRSLQVLDQAILILRHDHTEYNRHHSLQMHVEAMRLDLRYVGVVSIIGPKGEVIATNTPTLTGNFSDREYFKYHAENSADELLVGKPIIGKLTGKWLVSLTRRITKPDGSFGGLIFMAVDPNFFVTSYAPRVGGPRLTVALVGLDGIARLRINDGVTSYGEDNRNGRLFKELAKSQNGNYVTASAIDGQARIVSYRRIHDYPLAVVVGSLMSDVMAMQKVREYTYLSLALACTVLISTIGILVSNSWRRIEDALERVRNSESRLQSIFDVAPVSLAINNSRSEITHLNAAFVATLGYSRGDIPTLTEWWAQAYPDPVYRAWVNSTWVAELQRSEMAHTEFVPFEVRVRCKDGTYKHVMASATAMPGSNEGEHLVVLLDITAQNTDKAYLNNLVQEKNALLKEVHHRVKNNLQVITSLLRLEGHRAENLAVRSTLSDMQWRIRTMALVHESLYRTGNYAAIGLDIYLQQLAAEVFRSLLEHGVQVELQLDLQPVNVSMNMATPCGLIVNELISNALKHGFKDGRAGVVKISLQRDGKSPHVRLCVMDTGAGLPEDFESRRQESLGMQLVSDLALQIGATLTIGPGQQASFCLDFTTDITNV